MYPLPSLATPMGICVNLQHVWSLFSDMHHLTTFSFVQGKPLMFLQVSFFSLCVMFLHGNERLR